MSFRNYFFLFILLFICSNLFAQHDNIRLNNKVYPFLQRMKVKGIIESSHDYFPVISRKKILQYLEIIRKSEYLLNEIEKVHLSTFENEFSLQMLRTENQTEFFNPYRQLSTRVTELNSNKKKIFYSYKDDYVYAILGGLGYFTFGSEFDQPVNRQAGTYFGGFYFRGTINDFMGYNLTVQKGGANGSDLLEQKLEPALAYNFKYIEKNELVKNYDFTDGYVRLVHTITDNSEISFQLGREEVKAGYGYSNSLFLSKYHPSMDAIRFDFNYGYVHFISWHGTTVGNFSTDRFQNFTKHLATHQLIFIIPEQFEFVIGESTVYSRGIEIGYVTPLAFYKFIEHSMQDRDNSMFYFGFQSRWWKNIELQASFLMDEDILSNLDNFSYHGNKIAFQAGMMINDPFSILNSNMKIEYTNIRPYVYSHWMPENTYTAFGTTLGHPIGPNSDQLFLSFTKYLNQSIELNIQYSLTRSGKNILDTQDIVLLNVGSDINKPFRDGIDSDNAYFLSGNIEISNHYFIDVSYEFSTNMFLAVGINQLDKKYLNNNVKYSYYYIKYSIEY